MTLEIDEIRALKKKKYGTQISNKVIQISGPKLHRFFQILGGILAKYIRNVEPKGRFLIRVN